MSGNGDVVTTWSALRRRPRLLLGGGTITAIVVYLLLLLVSDRYKAHATFMPSSGGTGNSDLGALLSGGGSSLGVGGGIAASLGISSNAALNPKFYADLVTSDMVLLRVLDSTARMDSSGHLVPPAFNYIRTYHLHAKTPERLREDALRHLRRRITVDLEPRTSVVTIEFSGRTPAFSVWVLRTILDALNQFNIETLRTTAHAKTHFLEGRVAAMRDDVAASEAALRDFLVANRAYLQSPVLVLRQLELRQDYTLKDQDLVALITALERARVDEVRDTPILTVLDQPLLPGAPSFPKRGLLALEAAILWIAVCALTLASRAASARGGGTAEDTEVGDGIPRFRTRDPADAPTP